MTDSFQVRITSDGTATGTAVHVGDNLVAGVTSVEWRAALGDKEATAVITVIDPTLDAVGTVGA